MLSVTRILTVIIVLCFTGSKGAKILGVYPLAWGSHYNLGLKLMSGLAEAGHDVTFMTPYPTKNIPTNGKWTDLVLDGIAEEFEALKKRNKEIISPVAQVGYTQPILIVGDWITIVSNYTLHHAKTQKLINSGTTFDAVIIGQLAGNDMLHFLAKLFKAHLIINSSLGPNFIINPKVGNPAPVASVSNMIKFLPELADGMGFIPRLKNLIYTIAVWLVNQYMLSNQRKLLPNELNFEDLYYNVSLVFLNSYPGLMPAVPTVPNMVEIAGYHVTPPKILPGYLQEFLNDAKDGAIYFSLGSGVKSKDLPPETIRIFLKVFKELKQKVLWKFEDDLSEIPENVLIDSWLPQVDILAHPNIKLFITHGGLLSTIETIYHGVPVLCFPIFGDQTFNAESAVKNGFGLQMIDFVNNVNEQNLKDLIDELLYNTTYADRAKQLSKIYHDRPMSPMQTAVYWIEYVIRHNGAPHLRVAGVGMPWYKYYMVDVLSFLLISILFVLFMVQYSVRLLVFKISNRRQGGAKKKLL